MCELDSDLTVDSFRKGLTLPPSGVVPHPDNNIYSNFRYLVCKLDSDSCLLQKGLVLYPSDVVLHPDNNRYSNYRYIVCKLDCGVL